MTMREAVVGEYLFEERPVTYVSTYEPWRYAVKYEGRLGKHDVVFKADIRHNDGGKWAVDHTTGGWTLKDGSGLFEEATQKNSYRNDISRLKDISTAQINAFKKRFRQAWTDIATERNLYAELVKTWHRSKLDEIKSRRWLAQRHVAAYDLAIQDAEALLGLDPVAMVAKFDAADPASGIGAATYDLQAFSQAQADRLSPIYAERGITNSPRYSYETEDEAEDDDVPGEPPGGDGEAGTT